MANPLFLIDFGKGKTFTVPKADPSALIYQGTIVTENSAGRFAQATATTVAGTRGWVVANESPAGCKTVSVVFRGVAKVLFGTTGAFSAFTGHLTSYAGVTNRLPTIGASGTVTGIGAATAAGTTFSNNGTATLDVIKKYGTGFVTRSKEASVERSQIAALPSAVYAYVLIR